MKLISLKIEGFKNLDFWENPIDFTKSEGISIFVGNNGSGKSNVLEAISAIFYGLYDETNERRCNFSYELGYETNGKNIKIIQLFFKGKKDAIGKISPEILAGVPDVEEGLRFVSCYIDLKYIGGNLNNFYLPKEYTGNYLPSQIIALYSGEETRLYENYYSYSYNNFIKGLITNTNKIGNRDMKMIFINKNFWNIALLTMFSSDINLEKIIGDNKIFKINFEINQKNLEIFNKNNPNKVTIFASVLNTIIDSSLDDFKDKTIVTHKELYNLLFTAYLPEDENYKLINSIDIEFENGINANSLSEGQKKQILIYFVTQILADNDSIILLDEPDSYIHVGNKQRLKEFFDDFLYSNEEDKTKHIEDNRKGEIIMTTHSPTLMHKFDKKHLFYLENGKLDDKNKAEILKEIAGGIMSYTEQQIILNTTKDILIVEGKTDEIYIQSALEKLKEDNPQYKDLDFEFIPAGGADGIQLFMNKFKPKAGQKIMVFFDRDARGWEGLEKILGKKITDRNSFTYEVKNEYYISCYPKKTGFTTDIFVIEDYFKLKLFTDFLLKDSKCFQDIPKKDNRKTDFANECKIFDKSEFEGFKALFDLINSF